MGTALAGFVFFVSGIAAAIQKSAEVRSAAELRRTEEEYEKFKKRHE